MSRALRCALAALIAALAPGLPAYAAAVRVVAVPKSAARVPAGVGAQGLQLKLGGTRSALGSVSLGSVLSAGGAVSVAPRAGVAAAGAASASFTPAPAAAAAASVEPGAPTASAVAPRAASEPAAARPGLRRDPARAPPSGRRERAPGLRAGLAAIAARAPRFLALSGGSLKHESGREFDGAAVLHSPRPAGYAGSPRGDRAAARAGNDAIPAAGRFAVRRNGLARAELRHEDRPAPAEGVDSFSGRAEPRPAPKQKLSRAIRIGALTALAMFAVDMAVMAGASLAGYEFRPDYQMPALSDPAAFSALGSWLSVAAAKLSDLFTVALMAPYNEEVYFRAGAIGLMGFGALRMVRGGVRLLERVSPKLAKLRPWIGPAAFGVAATEAALFFALLHEMSDPVLITVRVVQALLFSYLYVREGLSSGLAHHAVFNGVAILALPLISTAAGAVIVGPTLIAAALAAAAAAALWLRTRATARAEEGERRAGRLAPYRLSARASSWLARFGVVSVAVLAALASLQAGTVQAALLIGMALQLVPAVLAFSAYGFLLKNLERRRGAAAADAIRNPSDPLPMGNRIGWQAAGVLFSAYAGLIGGMFLINGVIELFLKAGIFIAVGKMVAVAAAIVAVPWAAIALYRLRRGERGIPVWLYDLQIALGTAALTAGTIQSLLPALMSFVESAAGLASPAGMTASLASLSWTLPVFLVLAAGMTVLGRYLSRTRHPALVGLSLGYRVRRATAAALIAAAAWLPFVKAPVAAPRMGAADRAAVVAYYQAHKPKLVLMDWDNTFMDNESSLDIPVSPERVELLRALKSAGIRVGFVTNRPLPGDGYGMESVLLSRLPAELRADFILSTGGGAEVWRLGADGAIPAKPTRGVAVISDADRALMHEAMAAALAAHGVSPGGISEQDKLSYEYALVLRDPSKRDAMQAIFDDFLGRLERAGIADKFAIKLKIPVNAANDPYVRVRAKGAAKKAGVEAILAMLLEQGDAVDENEVLYFGDEFAPGEDDSSAVRGVPGGLGFSVGKTLAAGLPNTHWLPDYGPDATAAFLWDIIGGKPSR